MKITVCTETMDFPDQIGEMRDSNDLLGIPEALRNRMQEDGYLLLRGFHPREEVLHARRGILNQMEIADIKTGQHREMAQISTRPEIMRILESSRLFAFFQRYFDEPALTFDEKWLRAVGNGGFTGIHYDNVYMGRGSSRLHTVWTPFGDVPATMGTLAVCVGSNREGFRQLHDTYGRLDVDRSNIVGTGWYSNSPGEVLKKFGGQWRTTDVRAGDIIIITMFTLHCSTMNMTEQVRLSCDTRFQPSSEPADERWCGPNRVGHTAFGKPDRKAKTMEEARADWGV